MKKLEGLIFDLEGTLLDGSVDLLQAINFTLADHGRRALTIREIKSIVGEGTMKLVQQAFAVTGAPIGDDIFPQVQQFIHYYREIKPDPAQIYPKTKEVLEDFSSLGIQLGICTNKGEASTIKLLEQLGLYHYFEFVAGGDTYPVHKPNPEHVNEVLRALDISREGCFFIGDSLNDIRASHGALIPCVLITHGDVLEPELAGMADLIISELDEVRGAAQKFGFEIAT